MDRLTEARAVFAPKRRVSPETWMTDSLTPGTTDRHILIALHQIADFIVGRKSSAG
jgi:hypothetical protein